MAPPSSLHIHAPRPAKAGPNTLRSGTVSRVGAAHLCKEAVQRMGAAGVVYAPLGDAGRVAVGLRLPPPSQASLGWIEIPLSGEVVLHVWDTSTAAALAPRIASAVASTFAKRAVRSVSPDGRSWHVGAYRVEQAPDGSWSIVGLSGSTLAVANRASEAVRIARACALAVVDARESAVATPSAPRGTGASS